MAPPPVLYLSGYVDGEYVHDDEMPCAQLDRWTLQTYEKVALNLYDTRVEVVQKINDVGESHNREGEQDKGSIGVGAVLWEAAIMTMCHLLTSETEASTHLRELITTRANAKQKIPTTKKASRKANASKRTTTASAKATPLRGVRAVELGTGTGLLASALAAGGCVDVVATDLERVVPLMKGNLSGVEALRVEALPWGCEHDENTRAIRDQAQPDLVVVTDPVYQPHFVTPFVHTMRVMMEIADEDRDQQPPRVGVVCYEMRDPEVATRLERELRDAFECVDEHSVCEAVEGYEELSTDHVRMFVLRQPRFPSLID